jgi:exopolyphosphatase / guanosine-5'-triphosphate,3'-diphosphate pyrophosphatase
MPRYAAIDIGSNSIRMEVAETAAEGPPRILAADREVTRLGESVLRTGRLSEDAIALAAGVLSRMAARYQALDVAGVRAVATASVRDARNQAEFLDRASRAAATPVEVISGREEARLIDLGVASRWPEAGHRILLIDIGGGSAEIIRSEHGHMRQAVSKPLGAIRLKEIFLAHDPPLERELAQMNGYIQERLSGVPHRFGAGPWDRAIATSATAAAVVCAINGAPRAKRDAADRLRASTSQVRRLCQKLKTLDLAGRRRVSGIGPRRAEIIVPGITLLLRVLEAFSLRAVYYSAAGVRDGIIADLAARGVGRERYSLAADDRREVEQIAVRYGVPRPHARKVAALASALFRGLEPLHQLPSAYGGLLEAAAYLHDIGHFVAESSHHKHSYYAVANSELAGFTNRERELVANLCRYHRKALPAPEHANLRSLNPDERKALLLLIPLLRLADNLDRGHAQRVQSVECALRDGHVVVGLNASQDVALEQWAAERVGEAFRQIYGRPLVIARTVRGTA